MLAPPALAPLWGTTGGRSAPEPAGPWYAERATALVDPCDPARVEVRVAAAVKIVDAATGTIGGLAIPFGGPFDGRDFDGETFTAKTNFALDWFPRGRPLLYQHGRDSALGQEVLGRQLKATVTERGIWATAQLNLAHEYAQEVLALLGEERLGFSSGAMANLVAVDAQKRVTNWPWIELSLTPVPANPYAIISPSRTLESYKALGLTVPAECALHPAPAAGTLSQTDVERIITTVLTDSGLLPINEAPPLKEAPTAQRDAALADAGLAHLRSRLEHEQGD